MRHAALVGSLALLLCSACTTAEEAQRKHPKTPPAADDGDKDEEPEPPKEPVAVAAISSVQMIQDCPDPKKGTFRPPPANPVPAQAPAAAAKPASPMPAAPPAEVQGSMAEPMDMDVALGDSARGMGGFEQPCTQSTLQLSFTGQGKVEAPVKVQALRLLDAASSKEIATVEAREPAVWAGSKYEDWNETIGAGKSLNTSYKLSMPDWSKVERSIGKSSFGTMFILEVDVKVGDEVQTIRSAQFPREEPHIIVT